MNNMILEFPNNGGELIEMYLDKIQYKGLIERGQVLSKALRNQLTKEEWIKHGLKKFDTSQLIRLSQEADKRIFHAAVHCFAKKVCELQIQICCEAYGQAEWGEEMEYIQNSIMPDIYEKGQYQKLEQWWSGLDEQARRVALIRFRDYFTADPDDENSEKIPCEAWYGLTAGQREKIYEFYNGERSDSNE